MKRLVFCFDGTTNELGAENPTNVVRVAQSITPITNDSVIQIIHYDEGVGTVSGEKFLGGTAGKGLYYNVVEAYKFLIFNYSVHDEIYIFGFSRGAFTARVFAGLIQNCGILPRSNADKIKEVEATYKARSKSSHFASDEFREFRAEYCQDMCFDDGEDEWRVTNIANYVAGSAERIRITYLGVWDTVRSIGFFDNTFFNKTFGLGDERYEFYDASLSDTVIAARHAMAIDERRKKFNVLQWDNVDELNRAKNFEVNDPSRPYQQVWFPGTHGGVGGGGDHKGLSDGALEWILDGARNLGLQIDTDENSPLFDLQPNPFDFLDNIDKTKDRSFSSKLMDRLPKKTREPWPKALHEVSDSAVLRWNMAASELAENVSYRPQLLSSLDEILTQQRDFMPTNREMLGNKTSADGTKFTYYEVKFRDTLGKIAEKFYGDASRYKEIADFNFPIITDPDKIYEGRKIRIPNAKKPNSR